MDGRVYVCSQCVHHRCVRRTSLHVASSEGARKNSVAATATDAMPPQCDHTICNKWCGYSRELCATATETCISPALARELAVDPEPCSRVSHSLIALLRTERELELNQTRESALLPLQTLARAPSAWDQTHEAHLTATRAALIGGADEHGWYKTSHMGDYTAVCMYDCYRRMRALEPLVSSVLRDGVEGDFCEAGVLKGGISIYLATLLEAAGELKRRRFWLADSFAGMPPSNYTATFSAGRDAALVAPSVGRYREGNLLGTLEQVRSNMQRFIAQPTGRHEGRGRGGVHYLPGYFRETLPTAPIERLALLRADSDLFASTFETLEHLYPKLSFGGFVVFDDWKIAQARAAILHYRRIHNISTRVLLTLSSDDFKAPKRGSARTPGADVRATEREHVFETRDRIAFWQKSRTTG